MSYEYKGQEKVKILKGQHKGLYGYVRLVMAHGFLWVILDNGLKTNIHKDDVEFIHKNYFLVGIEEYKKSITK